MEKIQGIYIIKNKINNNIYIGSSINIKSRLAKHFSLLRKNKHENNYLQNAVNKYGIENFTYLVLNIIEDKEDLLYMEQIYIDLFNPKYNITKKVIRNTLSKESRIKISNTLKLKYLNKEITLTNTKKVDVYDLNGNFIYTYDTIINAAKDLKVSSSSIFRCLNNTYKQVKGFQFFYNGSNYKVNKISRKREVEVEVYNYYGEYLGTFKSKKEVAKLFNLNYSTINQHTNKRITKHINGFQLKTPNSNYKVINLDNVYIKNRNLIKPLHNRVNSEKA